MSDIQQMVCDDCRRSTAGRCGLHSTWTIPVPQPSAPHTRDDYAEVWHSGWRAGFRDAVNSASPSPSALALAEQLEQELDRCLLDGPADQARDTLRRLLIVLRSGQEQKAQNGLSVLAEQLEQRLATLLEQAAAFLRSGQQEQKAQNGKSV